MNKKVQVELDNWAKVNIIGSTVKIPDYYIPNTSPLAKCIKCDHKNCKSCFEKTIRNIK